jgi:hypothetical protein
MRFFRASESVYEQVRVTLNDAWGLPDSYGTQTCYLPAELAVRDPSGLCLLAVDDAFCNYSVAVDMLPQLLASGAVEEITAEQYGQAAEPLQG